MEITDWSDLKQFDQIGMNNDNSKKGSDTKEEEPAPSTNENEDKKQTNKFDNLEVTDWADVRKFDDDHDDDWFSFQEKKLAEQYGGNFIRVKYADHGRVSYFCELCVAECNAKKSLELHCSGMKHLKKKDLWEKEGKPNVEGGVGIKVAVGNLPSDEKREKRGRSPRRRSPYRGRSPPFRGRSPPYRGRSPPFRGRSPPLRSRSPPFRRGGEPFHWERNRRDEFPPFGRDDFDRDRFGRDSFLDRDILPSRFDEPWSSRSRISPLRLLGYGIDRDREERRSRHSPDLLPRYESGTSVGSGYKPRAPSPPSFSGEGSKSSLSENPAGSLLQKLSECCVKSADDADLAMNVVAALTRSLKEYSQRNGENKIAELLLEAEMKIGTVKALKVGMKMLSSFADSSKGKGDPINEMSLLESMKPKQEGKPKYGGESSYSAPTTQGSQGPYPGTVQYPNNPYSGPRMPWMTDLKRAGTPKATASAASTSKPFQLTVFQRLRHTRP